MTCKVARP